MEDKCKSCGGDTCKDCSGCGNCGTCTCKSGDGKKGE